MIGYTGNNNEVNEQPETLQKVEEMKNRYKLIVEVRDAKNLEDKKMIGSHAIYVAIDVFKETKRTKTTNNIINSTWNETIIFELKEIPEFINIRVRDDRMLLPNLNLGHYKIDIRDRIISNDPLIPTTLVNGEVKLQDTLDSYLNLNVTFQDINIPYIQPNLLIEQDNTSKNTTSTHFNSNDLVQGNFVEVAPKNFNDIPEVIFDKVIVNENKNINNLENKEIKSEYHVLPTIRVEEPPKIIEKEVEYIKPVEIHQTIIEKELPKIIEKPIIVEKKEHYLEPTEIIREENQIITQGKTINNNNDTNNNAQIVLENLKQQREQQFQNQLPIIEHKKEQIILDTDVQEKPNEIRTREVIYEQPVEIEKKEIEKIKPTVVENITIAKDHVVEKEAPQVVTQDVTLIKDKDHYYSQQDQNNSTLSSQEQL